MSYSLTEGQLDAPAEASVVDGLSARLGACCLGITQISSSSIMEAKVL